MKGICSIMLYPCFSCAASILVLRWKFQSCCASEGRTKLILTASDTCHTGLRHKPLPWSTWEQLRNLSNSMCPISKLVFAWVTALRPQKSWLWVESFELGGCHYRSICAHPGKHTICHAHKGGERATKQNMFQVPPSSALRHINPPTSVYFCEGNKALCTLIV